MRVSRRPVRITARSWKPPITALKQTGVNIVVVLSVGVAVRGIKSGPARRSRRAARGPSLERDNIAAQMSRTRTRFTKRTHPPETWPDDASLWRPTRGKLAICLGSALLVLAHWDRTIAIRRFIGAVAGSDHHLQPARSA